MVALGKKQNAVYPKPLLGKSQKNCTWYRDITDVYYCPCRWAGTNICLGALFLFNKTNKLYTPISNRCYKQLKLKRKTLHCSGWGTFICCFKGLAMKSLISNWKHGNILNHRELLMDFHLSRPSLHFKCQNFHKLAYFCKADLRI